MQPVKILLAATLFIASLTAQAQGNKPVSGTILGDDGQPVIGAAVLIAGTTKGVVSDINGKYSIDAGDSDVLIFSSLGYEELRENVNKRKLIDVVLKAETTLLDEAVAIGYGTQTKSDLTGSVTMVNMDEVMTPALTTVDQALQGRVAGVDIVSGGGEPGQASTIRIRGVRSISANNDPLIVLDGIIGAVDNFSDINPDDIQSITVLKDASSTAIYGARGSNGVIVVTTKGGVKSKLNINVGATFSLSELPRKLDVMDASEFAQYRNDYRYINSLTTGSPKYNQPIQEGYYAFTDPMSLGVGTDWQEVLTRKAFSQTYRVNVAEGDSKQHASLALRYDRNQGIIIGTDMDRLTTHLKFDRKLFKIVTFGLNIFYTYRKNNQNSVKINGISANAAVCLAPVVAPNAVWNRYSEDGAGAGAVFDSPYLAALKQTNFVLNNYLSIAPWLDFKLTRDLSLKTTFSYSYNDNDNFYYSPGSLAVAYMRQTGGTATRSDSKKKNLLSETTLTWKKTYNKVHKFDVVGGFTAQQTQNELLYVRGTGFLDDVVGANNIAGNLDRRATNSTSSQSEIRRMSVLGRANYSYASRYFVTLTARADGSSNFAAGHKWGFFPAVALKWAISSEPWMKKAQKKWMTNFAVRLSAGRSGNDAVGSYVSQAILANATGNWVFGDSQQVTYYPSRLDNSGLTWEKTDVVDAGLDLSILKDRVTIALDGYWSRTKDLLLEVRNAAQTGYTSRYANIGGTRGYGVELSISSHNISRKKFHWKTDFTISHNTSLVTDVGNEYEYIATYSRGTTMMFGYKKGYPANALWGYQYEGVWHNDAERAENNLTKMYVSYSNTNGFAKYADVNHDGILDDHDLIFLGSSDPVVSGGLNNSFNIGKFEISAFLTYSIGGKIYNISEMLLGSALVSVNKYRYMMDGWHPVRNPDSDIPAAYSNDSYPSSRFVHDASFLRLKSVSISYTFDLRKRIKWLSDINLSLNGENLFLLTGYNGYDPDVTASKAVARLDDATYPTPRTYSLSVKIRY